MYWRLPRKSAYAIRAGDTIHVEVEVIEARVSKSRPDRGLVRSKNEIVKQDGTVVITYTPLRLVKLREPKSQ